MSHFYIGLLSGTSVDGIDAVLVDFSSSQDKNNEKDQSRKRESIRVLASHCLSLPQSLSKKIHTLCQDKTLSPASLGKHPLLDETHQTFGNYCAQAALEVLALAGVEANQVQAIGSHGQTVHHQPPTANQLGFSLQIGCANTIAKSTGIKTVSDFRSADMQAGGHGAPLAPAFHQAIAVQDNDCYVFLNLGGIANITLIHQGKLICGFDTGPANTLMDAWVQLKKNLSYDKDGAWAVTGKVNAPLLKHLLADPYFRLVPPKSTGREYFNVSWLQQHLDTQRQTIADQDIQATLLALTAYSVCNTLLSLPHQPKHIYVCGGGAHNKALMASLRTYLDDSPLNKTILGDTQILGIHPDDIEACLFAWLAKQHIESQAIDLRSVTGASTVNMLGKLTI